MQHNVLHPEEPAKAGVSKDGPPSRSVPAMTRYYEDMVPGEVFEYGRRRIERDDGRRLSQVNAVLLWLAEQHPEAKLGPEDGADGRYAMQNLLSYFNGDVHPAFTPYFITYRYTDDDGAHEGVKEAAARELDFHLSNLDRLMEGRTWVMGDRRAVLDAYLFVFCTWARFLPKPLDRYPNLKAFAGRMMQDDGVKAALEKQGMK